MKAILPVQKRQLRKLAALSTELWSTQRGLVDLRHEKMENLLQRKMDLRKLEAHASYAGANSESGSPAAWAQAASDAQPRIASCRETIGDLEDDIRELDVRIAAVSADFAEASRFVERLLEYSGQDHDDFPNASTFGFGFSRTI